MAPPGASEWTLIFDDEFNVFNWHDGRSGVWQTHYWWGGRTLASNHELEFYADPSAEGNPFGVHDGVLEITASPSSGNPLGLPYNSGVITTFPSFSFTYGYIVMRAQLAAGEGMWSQFWLAAADRTWPPEIDIMEGLGQAPHQFSMNTHNGRDGHDMRKTPHQATVAADLTAGFHTYGVDWEPDKITWYFDGAKMASLTTPSDMHKPMYLIANLAVAGSRGGPPPTRSPGHLKIDYIRVYARNGTVSAAPPVNGLRTNSGPTEKVEPSAPIAATDVWLTLIVAICCIFSFALVRARISLLLLLGRRNSAASCFPTRITCQDR